MHLTFKLMLIYTHSERTIIRFPLVTDGTPVEHYSAVISLSFHPHESIHYCDYCCIHTVCNSL